MSHSVEKTSSLMRLETFADAVVAVAITLMVLDLKPPEITLAIRQNVFDFSFLHHYWPRLLALTLSFLVIAQRWIGLLTYFRPVTRANLALVWLTMANLFAICLIPWGTAFLAENPTLPQAVSIYGFLGMLVLATAAALERKIEIDYSGPQDWSFRKSLAVPAFGRYPSPWHLFRYIYHSRSLLP
jgi:TMEM175 potassium channel family protein